MEKIEARDFLYKKVVDKSVLYQGITIEKIYHKFFQLFCEELLYHGSTVQAKILLDGKLYDVDLNNEGFNQRAHPGHSDIIQFRYSSNTSFALKLQEIFYRTKMYVDPIQAAKKKGDRSRIVIPEGQREYIVLSSTNFSNIFIMDCITLEEDAEMKKELIKMPEYDFEKDYTPLVDPTATVVAREAFVKFRKLDKSIGDSLKKLYDYRCQVTGERIGEEYGCQVVESHHLDPFMKSLNNDAENIIILSPNFHRIVHKAKAEFNKADMAFVFPNGVREKVKLDKHLKNKY